MLNITQFNRFAIAAAISTFALCAQSPQPMVQAEQPFAIHGQSYSAGMYRVKDVSPSGIVTLRHEPTGQTVMLMTDRTGSPNSSGAPRLVFAVRNGQPELKQVWTGTGSGHVVR